TAVHPDSPLQGWRLVLRMLLQAPGRALPAERAARSPAVQLAAWDDLLRLQPPRTTLQAWLPRFEELRANHPNLHGITAVAARMHLAGGSAEAARLAQAWVVDADGDPDAWLCRMQERLRRGLLPEACDDGMSAVQESVDGQAAIAAVIRICEAEAPALAPGAVEGARSLARQFQELAFDEPPGGRR
ncbi:MAG: hypothetical protein WBO45_08920, partial [Planctomycetota bacterium]